MERIKTRADILEDRLITFGIMVVRIAEALPNNDFGKKTRDQLSRSGPSPAQNYGEMRSAESRRDFIHKMKIGLKELRETFVSIKLVKKYMELENKSVPTLDTAFKENDELISIFVKSIQTAAKKD